MSSKASVDRQLAEMKNVETAFLDHDAHQRNEEREKEKLRTAALEEHERIVAPYSDGLPYDRDRVIAAAKSRIFSSFLSAVECGKYLIWLQAEEQSAAFALTLERYFPEISRRTAFNFMRLAKIAVEHPKMKMLAENNRSKAIALLEILNEDDIEALEDGGIVAGITLEEVDKIPARQLKDKLRRYKKRVDRGEEQLVKLEDEVKTLKKALNDDRKRLYGDVIAEFSPEDQQAMEQLHFAHDHMWQCLAAIAMIDKEKTSDRCILIARDLCQHMRQLAVESFTEIAMARPEVCPSVEETSYWEERLPFNAKAKEKNKK